MVLHAQTRDYTYIGVNDDRERSADYIFERVVELLKTFQYLEQGIKQSCLSVSGKELLVDLQQ